MKIRPVGPELFHAGTGRTDGQTDMKTLIVALRTFSNEPKNCTFSDIVFMCLYLSQNKQRIQPYIT
jgi:hypothetical protein